LTELPTIAWDKRGFSPIFLRYITASSVDSHDRSIPDEQTLDLLFSYQTQRKVSKNGELSYKNVIYPIKTPGIRRRLFQSSITVCESPSGEVTLLYKNNRLAYTTFDKKNQPASIVNSKGLEALPSPVKTHKPKADHPWRRRYGNVSLRKWNNSP
jgi:hypothetical protein